MTKLSSSTCEECLAPIANFVNLSQLFAEMYSDPDEQRRFMRDRYRHEYWVDDEFRAAEAQRKAEWYARNWHRVREQQKIAYSKRRARAAAI